MPRVPRGLFVRLLQIEAIRVGTFCWTRDALCGVSLTAVFCLLYVSGFRKAELVDHGEGLTYLTRSSLRWHCGGVETRDPTREQLLALRPGDWVEVWPRQSKCDFTGEVWGDKPVFCHYGNEDGNACRAIAKLELAAPVHGVRRIAFPLLCADDGRPLSETLAQRIFDAMMQMLLPARASDYSWHSFRHGLATRLRAANCPADIIMQICRWQSVESLRTYAQLGANEYKHWLGASYTRDFVPSSSLDLPIDSAPAFGEIVEDDSWDKQTDGPQAESHKRPRGVSPARQPATPQRKKQVVERVLPPLTADDATGRVALVPRSRYPHESCNEHEGRGWEVLIISATSQTALVRFLFARSARGQRYEDTREPLHVLEPLS